jgi:hypothetical protein
MWGNKKPETPQMQPETKKFSSESAAGVETRRPGYLGGNYRNEYRCYASDGGDR